VEYYELGYPWVSETYGLAGDGSEKKMRSYGCDFGIGNVLSDTTIMRETKLLLGVLANTEILEKLGYAEGERSSFSLDTNSFGTPGLVDYLKVSTGPGKWAYVYDSSGINPDEGWGGIGCPASYREGLWHPGTGFIERYRGLGAAANYLDQCVLEEWSGSRPQVWVALLYDADSNVPDCPNDEDILGRARSYCAAYADFFSRTLTENAPYIPLLFSDGWRDYGFELRLNRLVAFPARSGNGVIYDGPVTFTRNYGSTELTVQ
jgi:hypothetical protein